MTEFSISDPTQGALDRAAACISAADAIVVTAGAGMGVDSGLPDFRGRAGFWRAYPALGRRGLSFEEVASPQTFRSDAALAWGFYGHRLQLYRRTEPHPGFAILRSWVQAAPLGGWVVTSNVDGQFQKAGFAPQAVLELHGSIHHLQCLRPCSPEIWSADGWAPAVDEQACRLIGDAPRCPRCGDLARPHILMFGDSGWIASRQQAQHARLQRWLVELQRVRAAVAVVEIGAGTAIATIRRFSEQLAAALGATLVRINPREPQVPGARHVALGLGALAALRALHARLAQPDRA